MLSKPFQVQFSVVYVNIFVFYIFLCWFTFVLKYLYTLRKKDLTCIPREHKLFWQLSWLDDFAINAIALLFVHERLQNLVEHRKWSFLRKFLTTKSHGVRMGSEYISESFFTGTFDIPLGKNVLQAKNWEKKGMKFYKCLAKLRQTNYCFYQKKVCIYCPQIRKWND